MINNVGDNLAWYCPSHNTRRWQALLRVSHTQVIPINEWHIKMSIWIKQTYINIHTHSNVDTHTVTQTNKYVIRQKY